MRVASDIGGTFTHLVYLDEATGQVRVAVSASISQTLTNQTREESWSN